MSNITDLLPQARTGLPQVPDLTLTAALNRAAVKFFRDTEIWRAQLTATALVSGTSNYTFNTPQGSRVERVLSMRAVQAQTTTYPEQSLALKAVSPEEMSNARAASGMPNWYSLSPTDYTFTTWPTPDSTTAGFKFQVFAVLVPTLTATTIPDRFGDEWGEAIAARARSDLMCQVGQPWHNDVGCSYYDAIYNDLAASAKRKQVSGERVPQRVRPRKFV